MEVGEATIFIGIHWIQHDDAEEDDGEALPAIRQGRVEDEERDGEEEADEKERLKRVGWTKSKVESGCMIGSRVFNRSIPSLIFETRDVPCGGGRGQGWRPRAQ